MKYQTNKSNHSMSAYEQATNAATHSDADERDRLIQEIFKAWPEIAREVRASMLTSIRSYRESHHD